MIAILALAGIWPTSVVSHLPNAHGGRPFAGEFFAL